MVVHYPLEIKHGWKIHENPRTKWKFIAGKIIEENASDELTTLGMKKLKKYENIAEWLYHPSCPWKWTLCVLHANSGGGVQQPPNINNIFEPNFRKIFQAELF